MKQVLLKYSFTDTCCRQVGPCAGRRTSGRGSRVTSTLGADSIGECRPDCPSRAPADRSIDRHDTAAMIGHVTFLYPVLRSGRVGLDLAMSILLLTLAGLKHRGRRGLRDERVKFCRRPT